MVLGLLGLLLLVWKEYLVKDSYLASSILLVELSLYCLLYTSDAADDLLCVDLGGRRIIKKKKKKKKKRKKKKKKKKEKKKKKKKKKRKKKKVFFFKQKTAYEMLRSLVGSEMCIRDSLATHQIWSTGFFTSTFGTIEMIMLYGSWIAWIITAGLEGVLGQRLLSRLFDTFGGIIFILSLIHI